VRGRGVRQGVGEERGRGRGGPVDSWMRASFRGFLRRDVIVGDSFRWLPLGAGAQET